MASGFKNDAIISHMTRIKINDNGYLEVRGSLDAREIIIFTAREDYNRDFALMEQAMAYFQRKGLTIARFESHGEAAMRRINALVPTKLPQRLRQVLKFCLLLGMPRHWRSTSLRYRQQVRSVEYKSECLRQVVETLQDKQLILLTRSVAGRAASIIADELGIKKLICIGYPFRKPNSNDEPERYAHLRDITTPFLIVQGSQDTYGGTEILEKYPLSPQVEVQFVPTDHDFNLPDEALEAVFSLIAGFIDKPSAARTIARRI